MMATFDEDDIYRITHLDRLAELTLRTHPLGLFKAIVTLGLTKHLEEQVDPDDALLGPPLRQRECQGAWPNSPGRPRSRDAGTHIRCQVLEETPSVVAELLVLVAGPCIGHGFTLLSTLISRYLAG